MSRTKTPHNPAQVAILFLKDRFMFLLVGRCNRSVPNPSLYPNATASHDRNQTEICPEKPVFGGSLRCAITPDGPPKARQISAFLTTAGALRSGAHAAL